MKLSYLMIANAVFAASAGLGMLFAAESMFAPYHMSLGSGGDYLAHVFGFMLLGVGTISWIARDINDKTGKAAILSGFAIAHLGAFVLAIPQALGGSQPFWFDVILHGAFGGGFAYYLLIKKS